MPTREQVYKAIDSEREYQNYWDNKRLNGNDNETQMDKDKPVECWVLWMEEYIKKAREEATGDCTKERALHQIRKVAALGVACMESLGAPEREKK
jgi:hypothetical protein